MKKHTKAALFGAMITIAALLVISPLMPSKAHAAVPAVPGGEQYKLVVVLTDQMRAPAGLEQQLNQLGVDGWKVRTAVGSLIVLAK